MLRNWTKVTRCSFSQFSIVYCTIVLVSFTCFFFQICLINDPRPEHDYNKLYTVQYLGNMMEGYPVRYINLTVDELKQFSIKALKEGEVHV